MPRNTEPKIHEVAKDLVYGKQAVVIFADVGRVCGVVRLDMDRVRGVGTSMTSTDGTVHGTSSPASLAGSLAMTGSTNPANSVYGVPVSAGGHAMVSSTNCVGAFPSVISFPVPSTLVVSGVASECMTHKFSHSCSYSD